MKQFNEKELIMLRGAIGTNFIDTNGAVIELLEAGKKPSRILLEKNEKNKALFEKLDEMVGDFIE